MEMRRFAARKATMLNVHQKLQKRSIHMSDVEIPHDHPNLSKRAAEIFAEYGAIVVRGLNKKYVEVRRRGWGMFFYSS